MEKFRKEPKRFRFATGILLLEIRRQAKVIPESRIAEYDIKLITRSGFLKEFKVFPKEQIEGIAWELPEISSPILFLLYELKELLCLFGILVGKFA